VVYVIAVEDTKMAALRADAAALAAPAAGPGRTVASATVNATMRTAPCDACAVWITKEQLPGCACPVFDV
jgi:hypothetical protein